jgi:hypothetical protein
VNYLVGDRRDWHVGLPIYERVRYRDAWPGIDVDWHGTGARLEYDFRVAPGADTRDVRLRFAGAGKARVAANGDLLLGLPGGSVRQRAPAAFQRSGDGTSEVHASYVVHGRGTIKLHIGHYDESRPLVIDPLLMSYSTFLGGTSDDAGLGIAVDDSGAAYVLASTFDEAATEGFIPFPATPGAFDTSLNGSNDVSVTKLSQDGRTLVYSTYVGGAAYDLGFGIDVDESGAAYVTGRTTAPLPAGSPPFPTTAGAFDHHLDDADAETAFVSKLTPDGSSLAYSTFLGDRTGTTGYGIAVDGSGAAFVTGEAWSENWPFPTTPGAFDRTPNGHFDAFVTKLNPAGSALSYSTLVGGSTQDIGEAIDVTEGEAVVLTGSTFGDSDYPTTPGAFDRSPNGSLDAVVTELSPDGTDLAYSTLLGGSGLDDGRGIAVDSSGAAYLTGVTENATTDYPTTPGAFDRSPNSPSGGYDAFVTKLVPQGAIAYSTLIGAAGGSGLAVDASGAAYVTGATGGTGYPTTADGFDTTPNGGSDAFLAALDPSGGALAYSTLLGGSGADQGRSVAVDGSGGVYLTGITRTEPYGPLKADPSVPYPTTPGAFDGSYNGQGDAFATKLAPPGSPAPPARCGGRPATIVGTSGDDLITGTAGSDVITALAGDDTVRGLGADDTVCGRAGADAIRGGGGRDLVKGGLDADRLRGGKGGDWLKGGPGADSCRGQGDALRSC